MSTALPTDRAHLLHVLAGWLAARWPTAADIAVDDLGGPSATGFSNDTVFFRARWRERGQAREGRYVARIEPTETPVYPPQAAEPMASVDVQYRIMQAVAAHGDVPLATLLGYEADTSILGRPFYVMGFVDGRVPTDWPRYTQEGFLVDEATPAQRRRLVESGIEVLARIHRIDWRQAGLHWLVPPSTTPGLRWQLDLFRDNARAELRGRAHPILEQAFAWLEAHYPAEGDRLGIAWGDARLGNMIFRDYECVAVTDWEAVALGPPELDLGWWLMFDRFIHESSGVTTRLDGMPTRAQQKAHYSAQVGRDIGDTHYFEVFAATRFTAVMIRTMDRMTKSGMTPPETNAGVHNVATQVLADLLGIPYNWADQPR
ncbi:MAG: phosphotransferase family protein [Candidatus Binatia bacterium]